MIEDHGTVLRPHVASLLVQRRRIMGAPEHVEDLVERDHIGIERNLYNFGMPAALKAWVDLIARPKVTFAYTENGPVGLVEGKRAIVAVASGGVPVGAAMDFATPHMELVLNFIGITDIAVHTAKEVVAKAA